jgi:hypothetical protein
MAMCGCGPTYENPDYEWTEWKKGVLVSIIDDSLAVLKIFKYEEKIWNDCGFDGCADNYEIVDSRSWLFLVNYRNKQKPLLEDALPYDLRIINEYYKDSSVLVFDKNNSQFGFWKIGAKSIELKKYNNNSWCRLYDSHGEVLFRARPWANGNILLKSGSCFLILNTETGQIKPFETSGEYEWLSGCVDMSYIGSKIACVKKNDSAGYFEELVVNDTITDTLAYNFRDRGISNWYGNYLKDNRHAGYLGHGMGEISKIDTSNFKFDNTFVPMKIENTNRDNYYSYDYSTFWDNSGSFVYEPEYLIGAGN